MLTRGGAASISFVLSWPIGAFDFLAVVTFRAVIISKMFFFAVNITSYFELNINLLNQL